MSILLFSWTPEREKYMRYGSTSEPYAVESTQLFSGDRLSFYGTVMLHSSERMSIYKLPIAGFRVEETSRVRIIMYDLKFRQKETLANKAAEMGAHLGKAFFLTQFNTFRGRDLASWAFVTTLLCKRYTVAGLVYVKCLVIAHKNAHNTVKARQLSELIHHCHYGGKLACESWKLPSSFLSIYYRQTARLVAACLKSGSAGCFSVRKKFS